MEANMAYDCLHKFHILPSQFLSMPRGERAFLYASLKIYAEMKKKEMQDAENKVRGR